MKKSHIQWLWIMIFVISTGVSATVALSDNFPEITAQELKAKLDSGQKLMLLNPLSEIEFKDQHIPGSINIPAQEILISKKLPKDKDQLLVTYCLGRK